MIGQEWEITKTFHSQLMPQYQWDLPQLLARRIVELRQHRNSSPPTARLYCRERRNDVAQRQDIVDRASQPLTYDHSGCPALQHSCRAYWHVAALLLVSA